MPNRHACSSTSVTRRPLIFMQSENNSFPPLSNQKMFLTHRQENNLERHRFPSLVSSGRPALAAAQPGSHEGDCLATCADIFLVCVDVRRCKLQRKDAYKPGVLQYRSQRQETRQHITCTDARTSGNRGLSCRCSNLSLFSSAQH